MSDTVKLVVEITKQDIENIKELKEEGVVWIGIEWLNPILNGVPLSEVLTENKGEPKTGHWIEHVEHCENLGVMPSGLGAYEWCSNCDCGIDVREWHKNHYNFCPNCGADMRGEADGK